MRTFKKSDVIKGKLKFSKLYRSAAISEISIYKIIFVSKCVVLSVFYFTKLFL